MITYHNRTHMTAVPTELLQDTHLSVEAKGFAAILYALGDEGVELSELACQLNMPEERISVVLTELPTRITCKSGRKAMMSSVWN